MGHAALMAVREDKDKLRATLIVARALRQPRSGRGKLDWAVRHRDVNDSEEGFPARRGGFKPCAGHFSKTQKYLE